MNTDRIFVALLSGLLTIDEDQLADAYELAAQFHRLDKIVIERRTGAAAPGDEDTPAFRQWLEEQRENLVKSVCVAVQADPDDDPDGMVSVDWERPVPERFAAGLPILMRIDTRRHKTVYVQTEMTGPRLALTASQFVELVNAQDDPDLFWPGVQAEVAEYGNDGDVDDLDSGEVQAYLRSPDGQRDWQSMGEQIFRHVQVDALAAGKRFVIPEAFSEYIEEVPPVDDQPEPMVWLEQIGDEVSAAALLRLIEAQDFGNRIWQLAGSRRLLEDTLDASVELDDFPTIAAAEWPRFLARLSDDEVWRVSEVLLELVRLECTQRGVQPCIPDDLADIFGPDEEERRWLEIDERLEHGTSWAIRETDEPMTLLVLDRIDGHIPSANKLQMKQASQQFIAAVTLAHDFARRVGSPFHPALGAARHLALLAGGTGPLDLAELASPDLDWQPELWQLVQLTLAAFGPFAWGADRLLGLAAMSAADVFGGADSWNDQVFEGEDDALFKAVTLTLFTALNGYFEALVSLRT